MFKSLAKKTSSNWKHIATVADGNIFLIDGLNVWDFKWIDTEKTVQVKDPVYHRTHVMNIYQIVTDSKKIEFAAGEYSNCVYGFYQQQIE